MSAFLKWAALACLAFALFVRVAAAELEPSNPPVKAEITAVIEAQLAAFRAGDFDKAYSFASSPIREMFPLSEFQNMVKTGYPIIATSVKADFGICLDNGSEASVFVHVEARDGTGAARNARLMGGEPAGGGPAGDPVRDSTRCGRILRVAPDGVNRTVQFRDRNGLPIWSQ